MVASVVMAVLPVLVPPARAGDGPAPAATPIGSGVGVTAAADAAYWTAQRMQDAVPVSPPGAARAVVPRSRPGAVAGAAQGTFIDGIPQVGTFFVRTTGGDSTCTGSVVHSPGKNLVLSAGHCLYAWRNGSTNRIFVPHYTAGRSAADQPYGFFPVTSVFVDPRFVPAPPTSALTDLDFGFASVAANSDGAQLEDVTGALALTTTPGYRNQVTVMGYPSLAHNPAGRTWTCSVTTAPLPGYHQMQMGCAGFYAGTSGGPWIAHYDATAHTGDVIGVVGGLHGGGDTDSVSYSPMFDDQIHLLYADAVHGAVTARSPYRPVVAPGALPGGTGVWRNARLLASGDYTGHHRSDLITVWADGKVSLFPAAADGGYGPEKVLTGPNPRWRTARLITGGDFDGNDLFDLMVVWNDGRLSSFVDTSPAGLGAEKRYAPPAAAGLSSAVQIVAGKFGNPTYVTDLLVLGRDGALTLYSDTGSGRLGSAHRLIRPGALWRQATLLDSGQYSHGSTWDLTVRWVDGELDNYPTVSRSGIGPERRLLNPNATWRTAAAITTGHVTTNPYTDDLLVRWPDGHVNLYPDTTIGRLGPEQPLTTSPS